MSDQPTAFTGTIPQFYDACLGPVMFADYALEMANRVAEAKPSRVLETAAGTGIVTRRLRDALAPDTALVATDLQEAMLGIARAKFAADERVEFAAADATALSFADGSFDAVVCQFGVMFYPDKDRGYREIARVLSPGGRYFFSVWDSHRTNAFARITRESLHAAFPSDPPQFITIPFSYGFDPIKDSLIAAGFTAITASVVRIEKDIPDLANFARGLIEGNPTADQLRARGANVDEFAERLTANLGAEFGTPARTILTALMFSATKA